MFGLLIFDQFYKNNWCTFLQSIGKNQTPRIAVSDLVLHYIIR